MSTTALDRDLQMFAVELFEHSGGVADWPVLELPGSVVLPADVVTAALLPGEEFSLDVTAGPGTLHVGLAGEFLDVAARVLDEAVPRDGSFCIPERYLTSRDLTDKIARTFTWHNARARCRTAEPALVEYHLWTLLGSLRSEDVWEAVFRIAVNAESQAIVELPDVFQEPDLIGEEPANVPGHSRHPCDGNHRRKATAHRGVDRIRPPRRTAARAGPQAAARLLSGLGAKRTARSVARRRFHQPTTSQPGSERSISNCVASWRN